MTRLPLGWHGPLTQDASAAELETDVMRFMAILALSLVAIFGLVQAIPLETPPAPEEPVVSAMDATTAAEPAKPPANTRAIPLAPLAPAEARTPVPSPPSVAKRPESPSPPDPLPTAKAANAGFILRFESDDALRTLVARSDVGLYAMHGDRVKRLHVGRGRLEFWQASMPSAFHEMDAATVPGDVVTALSRIDDGRTAVRWGVTLPPRLSQEIDRHLATDGDGDLVISATGALRRE